MIQISKTIFTDAGRLCYLSDMCCSVYLIHRNARHIFQKYPHFVQASRPGHCEDM